ncbi:unnamed protein product [Amoebophrya sp. A25]|nr:unnamed protein product [Amoebophrya sp. A25]|eukprot:GSA25T00005980001.1
MGRNDSTTSGTPIIMAAYYPGPCLQTYQRVIFFFCWCWLFYAVVLGGLTHLNAEFWLTSTEVPSWLRSQETSSGDEGKSSDWNTYVGSIIAFLVLALLGRCGAYSYQRSCLGCFCICNLMLLVFMTACVVASFLLWHDIFPATSLWIDRCSPSTICCQLSTGEDICNDDGMPSGWRHLNDANTAKFMDCLLSAHPAYEKKYPETKSLAGRNDCMPEAGVFARCADTSPKPPGMSDVDYAKWNQLDSSPVVSAIGQRKNSCDLCEQWRWQAGPEETRKKTKLTLGGAASAISAGLVEDEMLAKKKREARAAASPDDEATSVAIMLAEGKFMPGAAGSEAAAKGSSSMMSPPLYQHLAMMPNSPLMQRLAVAPVPEVGQKHFVKLVTAGGYLQALDALPAGTSVQDEEIQSTDFAEALEDFLTNGAQITGGFLTRWASGFMRYSHDVADSSAKVENILGSPATAKSAAKLFETDAAKVAVVTTRIAATANNATEGITSASPNYLGGIALSGDSPGATQKSAMILAEGSGGASGDSAVVDSISVPGVNGEFESFAQNWWNSLLDTKFQQCVLRPAEISGTKTFAVEYLPLLETMAFWSLLVHAIGFIIAFFSFFCSCCLCCSIPTLKILSDSDYHALRGSP